MRIRSLVSSAAIVGSLLASSALVSQALAQKGTFMSPSTSWAISKVDDQTNPYCALAKRFNQNTVLTVARNSQSETSFALDFQQPVFSTGQDVRIMLDPGAGQQRAYSIKPVSNKAFVVRLGRDASFFKAMERTGMLRVEIGEQSYHFNVSDIDAGESQLDACIASSVLPAAGDEEPIMAEPLSAPSSASVDAAVADASRSFRAEINTLRRQLSDLQTKNTALQTQLDTRDGGASEVSASVSQLSDQLRKLEDENIILKRNLAAAQTTAVVEADTETLSEISSLRSQLESMRREKLSLEAKVQSGEAETEQIVKLMDEIRELKSANQQLEAAVASPLANTAQDGAAVEQMEAQIRALETENEGLSADLLSMRESIKQNYESQIALLEKENRTLKSEQKTQTANSVDNELLEQLRSEIAKVENENRLLKETTAQASASLKAELQAQHQEEIDELKASTAGDIASLESEIERLLSAQEAKNSEVAAMDQQLETIERLRTEKQALKDELAESMRVTDELKASAGTVSETQQASANEAQAQVASLQDELTGLKSTNTALKQDMDAVKTELALVVSQNEVLRADIAAKEETISGLRENETKIVSLENENAALQEKIQQVDALKQDNEKALQDKDEQIAKLKADFTQQSEAESQDDAQYQAQLTQLEEQKEQLKVSLSEVILLAETLKSDNDEKAGRIAELSSENDTLMSLNASLEKKIEEQVEKIRVAAQEPVTKPQKVAGKSQQDSEQEPEVVKSVVLGDAAATTATASQLMASTAAALKSKSEPVKAAVKQQPVVSKVVPLPGVKPQVPTSAQKPQQDAMKVAAKSNQEAVAKPAAKMPVEAVAEIDPPAESLRKIDAAMAVLEEEMRNAESTGDDAALETQARQYAYLKAQRDYLTQQPEGAVVEQGSGEQAEFVAEEVLAADDAVNEAQQYEASLKAKEHVVEVVEQVEVEELQEQEFVSEAMDEPQQISVSQSVDPFEELSVENADGEVSATAPQEEAVELLRKPEVSSAPSRMTAEGASDVSITELVTAAHLAAPEQIKRVEKGSDEYDVAYQWSGGAVYGTAEQKVLPSPAQFDGLVQDYLERTQSRCPGEFAIVPDSSYGEGAMRADSYEVACIGDSVSSGASLLFFNKGGTFTVVAHEAPAEELDNAISMRDKVMRVVTGG